MCSKSAYLASFVATACLCLYSCTNSNENQNDEVLTDKTFQSEVSLSASDSLQINQIFRLYDLKATNNQLTIVDAAHEDTTLNVYSYPEGKLLHRSFSVGQGPNQFITVNTGQAKANDEVLIYDMMKHRVLIVNSKHNPAVITKEFALPIDENGMGLPFTYINQYNDSLFLMKYDDPRKSARCLVDLKNNKTLWKEDIPRENEDFSYTAYDYIQNLSDSTVIVAYSFSDLVEIYNISKDCGMQLKAKYGKRADFTRVDEDDLVDIYIDVTHDDKAFYCLRANKDGELGSEIETYDIVTFKPLKKIRLDKSVATLTVCGNKLIGYYPGEQSSIFYTWQLN
jgi:hypothetical protein